MSIENIKIISTTVTIICMLFITLLSITYYRKKRVENTETKIYSALLIINITALLSELIFYYYFQNSKVGIGLEISEKAYYASTIIWMYLITLYNFALSKQYSKLKIYDWSYKKKRNSILISLTIIIVSIISLPITRTIEDGVLTKSRGLAPGMMFLLCFLLLIINIILVIKNSKRLGKDKNLPMIVLFLVLGIEMIFAGMGVNLLLITLPMTLVSHLMYHTIENPDVKMLEEVSIAKEQAEKANTASSRADKILLYISLN
jgi:hypothetical protein